MTTISRREGLGMLAGVGIASVAPRALAQPSSPMLALVEKGDGQLSFYTLPDGRRLGSVPLGRQPHEIAADRERRFAYVGSYGVPGAKAPGAGGDQVWVIDLHQRSLVRTIELAPYHRIHAVRLDATGRLYAMSESDSVLARFDKPGTDKTPAHLWPVGGVRSHYLVVRGDGTRGYIADTLGGVVILLDLANPETPPIRRALGAAPEALALSNDERTLYAIDRPSGTIHALDAATLAVTAKRTMRGEAVRIVVPPHERLIVSNTADSSLTRLNPQTLAEEARLALPAAASGLTLSPDGRELYASLSNDTLAIVDLPRFAISGSFATGKAPDGAIRF